MTCEFCAKSVRSKWTIYRMFYRRNHPSAMKPLIEIRRIGTGAYSYRISAQGSDAQDAGVTFTSLAQCLLDAGASLDRYFESVEMKFDGMFLGACATEALRNHPKAVAQRFQQHFQPA
jgi:hypothetical protein